MRLSEYVGRNSSSNAYKWFYKFNATYQCVGLRFRFWEYWTASGVVGERWENSGRYSYKVQLDFYLL